MRGQLFSNITNSFHILSLTCLKGSTECGSKKNEFIRHRRLKGFEGKDWLSVRSADQKK